MTRAGTCREARRRLDAGDRSQVADVLPVGGDDEPDAGRAGRSGRRGARREEGVGVDDVRLEAASLLERVGREPRVLRPRAAAAVDDRVGELVAALAQLAREVGDEHPEVGCVRAGVHLGDEEDAHC